MTASHIPYTLRDHHGQQKRPETERQLHHLSDSELRLKLRRLDHEMGFITTEEIGKPLIREMERIQNELTRRKESQQ